MDPKKEDRLVKQKEKRTEQHLGGQKEPTKEAKKDIHLGE
jgi:hypothetical protein